MATNRHFGKDQSAAEMADAETPMEVESLPVPHVDGGAAASVAATTVDAPMQQEGEEEEKEEMPFTDDELAVCFKVSTHACQCLHTHVRCGMQW